MTIEDSQKIKTLEQDIIYATIISFKLLLHFTTSFDNEKIEKIMLSFGYERIYKLMNSMNIHFNMNPNLSIEEKKAFFSQYVRYMP